MINLLLLILIFAGFVSDDASVVLIGQVCEYIFGIKMFFAIYGWFKKLDQPIQKNKYVPVKASIKNNAKLKNNKITIKPQNIKTVIKPTLKSTIQITQKNMSVPVAKSVNKKQDDFIIDLSDYVEKYINEDSKKI